MKPPVFNYADYEQLQKKYTQAMELLGLAVEDMNKAACEERRRYKHIKLCVICKFRQESHFDGMHCQDCTNEKCNFRWKHADKLEELREGNADEM